MRFQERYQPGPPFSQMVISSTGSPTVGVKTKYSALDALFMSMGMRPEYISPRSKSMSGRLSTKYSGGLGQHFSAIARRGKLYSEWHCCRNDSRSMLSFPVLGHAGL